MFASRELIVQNITKDICDKYKSVEYYDISKIIEQNLHNYTLTKDNDLSEQVSINDKIDFFLNTKRIEGYAETTLRAYRQQLMLFSKHINKRVENINSNDLRQYFSEIQNNKIYKKTTYNNKINVIRSFFGFLHDEEIIKTNPSTKLKTLKVDIKSLRTALTIEEMEMVRNACKNIREKAIVEFLYSTGCRVTEAINIKVSDINWIDNSLNVFGKGGKTRRVYFSIKCKIYLQEYLCNKKVDTEHLFVASKHPYNNLTKESIESLIRKIVKRTNLHKKVTPHTFRHTIATHALSKGMDIAIIQQMLGHSEISTTNIYAEVSDTILKAAYNKYCMS